MYKYVYEETRMRMGGADYTDRTKKVLFHSFVLTNPLQFQLLIQLIIESKSEAQLRRAAGRAPAPPPLPAE